MLLVNLSVPYGRLLRLFGVYAKCWLRETFHDIALCNVEIKPLITHRNTNRKINPADLDGWNSSLHIFTCNVLKFRPCPNSTEHLKNSAYI